MSEGQVNLWDHQKRRTFYRAVEMLDKMQVRNPELFPIPNGSRPFPFPIDMEHRLANDVSFVASIERGRSGVTAATLHFNESGGSAIITLAANEGISRRVEEGMRGAFDILAKYAYRKVQRERWDRLEVETELLTHLASMSIPRLRDRLGQNHRKRHDVASSILNQLKPPVGSTLDCNDAEYTKLSVEFRNLTANIRSLNQSPGSTELSAVQAIVDKAYELTQDATAWIERLSRPKGLYQLHALFLDRGAVQQLVKIGRYRGTCHIPVKCYRLHAHLFQRAQLDVVDDATMISALERTRGYYVHCEIQLVIHHESHRTAMGSRTIGVSKLCCFLCNSFIQCHSHYLVMGTHGAISRWWGVSDILQVQSLVTQRLQQIMDTVERDLRFATIML